MEAGQATKFNGRIQSHVFVAVISLVPEITGFSASAHNGTRNTAKVMISDFSEKDLFIIMITYPTNPSDPTAAMEVFFFSKKTCHRLRGPP